MSGIFDQIINYSPPLIVSGTVNYKGTWNASTNNPTLNSSPAASTKGDYYVVSTAGTQFGITFAIGDWIISNGTAWEKVDLTDAVSSVFGRTGAVVGVSTDYSAVGITNTAIGASNPSTGAFTTVSASTPIAVASGGTGVSTSTGTTNVVLSNSPTIVTPVIAQINDASGNETLKLASIASAVNEVTIENAATGNAVHISATGGDASVGLHLAGKGASGYVNVQDSVDATKRIMFNAAGGTTNTRTMLSSTQTVDRTLTLPDATGTLLYGGGPLGTPSSGTVTNLTGTASININGTVGATTASTGVFTTLSTSGNMGIGTSVPSASAGYTTLQIDNATNGGVINLAKAGTVAAQIYSVGIDATISTIQAGSTLTINPHTANIFQIAGSEKGRFTSTGLAVTGALSATGIASLTGTSPTLRIGNQASGGAGAILQLAPSSTQTNWLLGANQTVSGAFEITPSTAGGGTTFTTPAVVVNSSGNVGIGMTPSNVLDITQNQNSSATSKILNNSAGTGARVDIVAANGTAQSQLTTFGTGYSTSGIFRANGTLVYATGAGGLTLSTDTAQPIYFATNQTERARITSSGDFMVGTTSTGPDAGMAFLSNTTTASPRLLLGHPSTTASGNGYVEFLFSGTAIGSITQLGTTAVVYNTTSDYRRKSNVKDLTGSGTFIDALKPRTFDWDTGDKAVGFIAHEFAEVSPTSVTGVKDAVDADGKPIYQSMQAATSEVIANLVAEIQSLRQRVAGLETK